jgi:hypothetical protein
MNTVAAAHQRLDRLEPKIDSLAKDVSSLQTEVDVQFREVFIRIKRIETILIGTAGTIIMLLISVLMKMG